MPAFVISPSFISDNHLFSSPAENTMPVVKYPRAAEPLWHEWDRKAQKHGLRHTVYAVNGDRYTGEWLDNLKHGKLHHLEKKHQCRCLYKSSERQGAVSQWLYVLIHVQQQVFYVRPCQNVLRHISYRQRRVHSAAGLLLRHLGYRCYKCSKPSMLQSAPHTHSCTDRVLSAPTAWVAGKA